MSRERRSNTLAEGQSSSTPNTSRAQNSAQESVGDQYYLGMWSMSTSLQASALGLLVFIVMLYSLHIVKRKGIVISS